MYLSVLILTVLYTILLVYIYLRYNLDAKDNSEYDRMYRDELDISASEAAYLIDKNCDSLNMILADILTLIQKDYIQLEIKGEGKKKEYIFRKKDTQQENSNIKAHEMSAYRLFFQDKNEINLKEYLTELKSDNKKIEELELKSVSIKNEIEYELRKQNITDEKSEKKLFKINKFSISIIFIFLISFITTIVFIKNNIEYIEFTSIGLLFSILLYRTTMLKEDKLTKYGVETKKKAIGFKNYLAQYLITQDKPLYMVNVLEYNYIMAVAFGFAKFGEKEFIRKTFNNIQRKKRISDIIGFIFNFIIILLIIILILKGEI